jgi:hypothetical protein
MRRAVGTLLGAVLLTACGADPAPGSVPGSTVQSTEGAPVAASSGGGTSPDAVPLDADVARAVTIVRALDAHPASADSVLLAHAISLDAFEALIFAIAADSAKSAQYARALAPPPP